MLRSSSTLRRPTRGAIAWLVIAAAVAIGAFSIQADDRDLLKESLGDPYVFIVFDTSGSMNWSTRCTAAQFAAGQCRRVCTDRDCFVPLNGDDPASKFFQAKEALFQVIQSIDDVNFGFASYNQDGLNARAKHFLYEATTAGPVIPGHGAFPAIGETDVFGLEWNCDTGSNDNNIGCYPNSDWPADLDDAWERQRVARLPKGQENFRSSQRFFIRRSGVVYWVEYRWVAGAPGDPTVQYRVDIERCNNTSNSGSCDAPGQRTAIAEQDVSFQLVSDFLSWDNGVQRANPRDGYFPQGTAADGTANNTCGGWEPNDDAVADLFNGYGLKFPTLTAPLFSPSLDRGDVLPLDWNDTNKDKVLQRLAPNLLLGETSPDFRTARYFQDQTLPGVPPLRLRNNNVRPLVPTGATPLGFAIANFRTWWAGCEQGSCPGRVGWSDIAAAEDPNWACRKKYLLVITDGDDTCPGRDPCSFTAALRAQENVFTYVVGFGVENTPGNRLSCMSSNGGTGDPIYPQNKQELVDALTAIFEQIREEARSFASAAVPNVQAVAEDKIFISSFTPLNNASVWPGRLDAFLRPIPLDAAGRPDLSRVCSSLPADEQGACHLWDAGQELLAQAPTPSEVAASNFRLGNSTDQRRVLYPHGYDLVTGAVPRTMHLFRPPGNAADRRDLWDGLGLVYDPVNDPGNGSSLPALDTLDVIGETLVQKDAIINNPDGTTTDITYIFGDVFHSNPTVVDNPDNFRNFAADLYGTLGGSDCASGNKGYRCFARKHEFRRKMLAVGADDGMLHFFNGGIFDPGDERYDNGDGSEILAVIPRLSLPIVKRLAQGTRQYFGVDGSPRVIDVFVDPESSTASPPAAADREWRTLAVTGLREGGIRIGGTRVSQDNGKPWSSGYFAVDVTQPDRLDGDNVPVNRDIVPTCITNYTTQACGPIPFGTVLWEFTDSVGGSAAEWGVSFDEDMNNEPDLGDTWSTAILGRVKLLDGSGGFEDRWVAIFGGGFDPANRAAPRRGKWLYMVDLETGEAIYKRPLDGAAPATPAVVDRNRDGYLDYIYIGTTRGSLYKVDLTTAVSMATVAARDLAGNSHDVQRVTDIAWEPFVLFDASADGVRRPIFFAPTVLSVAESGQLALAFGTGNREQLWDFTGDPEGRFAVIVDENYTRADLSGGGRLATRPRNETDYAVFDSEGAFNPGVNFLVTPPANSSRGWVLTLDPNERVVAQAFSVSGLTIFPTFKPQVVSVGGAGGAICARTGDSRVFAIFTSNADAVQPVDALSGQQSRSLTVGEALVTPPYAEPGSTVNADPGADPCPQEWRDSVLSTLQHLFPEGTRFANYTIEVNFIRSDTGIVCPIPVPIGIVENNWKEF